MKKRNLIFGILIGFLTFTSCSSDDDNDDSGTDVSIIGTWSGTSSTFNGNNSGIPDNNIVKFTSDNRTEFVYKGLGNNGQDISEFGNWTKSGNTLTITWDDADPGLENYVLKILLLNESTLKWQTEITGEGTLIEVFER